MALLQRELAELHKQKREILGQIDELKADSELFKDSSNQDVDRADEIRTNGGTEGSEQNSRDKAVASALSKGLVDKKISALVEKLDRINKKIGQ